MVWLTREGFPKTKAVELGLKEWEGLGSATERSVLGCEAWRVLGLWGCLACSVWRVSWWAHREAGWKVDEVWLGHRWAGGWKSWAWRRSSLGDWSNCYVWVNLVGGQRGEPSRWPRWKQSEALVVRGEGKGHPKDNSTGCVECLRVQAQGPRCVPCLHLIQFLPLLGQALAVLILISRWGHWGTERLNDCLKVAKLVRSQFKDQASLFPRPQI